ncbi:MAG: protein kinase [Chlamydiales bacterium]|nr:protein kinase [Chlamydiales bacterium]
MSDISDLGEGSKFQFDKLALPETKGKFKPRIVLSETEGSVAQIAYRTLTEKSYTKELNKLRKQETRSIFRRFVPALIGNKHVEVNIRSMAKRLGLTKDSIFEAAKAGTLETLFTKEAQAVAKHAKAIQNLGLSPNEVLKISTYIIKHKNDLVKQATTSGKTIYIRASKEIPRALQITPKGQIIVHLNKRRLGDDIIGEGSFKTVRRAVNADTGDFYAVARMMKEVDEKELDKEVVFLEKCKGAGIAELSEIITVDGKTRKKFFIQPLYESDLKASYQNLSKLQQLQITLDLLKGAALMEEKGVIHRDLKPANIFLSTERDGTVHAFIADFGLAVEEKSTDPLWIAGTRAYFAPEYSVLRDKVFESLENENEQIRQATTSKLDAWALGGIIRFMETRKHPYKLKEDLPIPETISYLEGSIENNPLSYLQYDLLRQDPAKRLSAKEALEKYQTHLEAKIKQLKQNP